MRNAAGYALVEGLRATTKLHTPDLLNTTTKLTRPVDWDRTCRSMISPWSGLGAGGSATVLAVAIVCTTVSTMEEFFCTWFTSELNSPIALFAIATKSGIPSEFQFSGLNPGFSTCEGGGREGIYRSSLGARKPQNPTNSEEYQGHLQ
eukprot:372110-Prorocentrum_minimum.AAC.1